MNTGATLFQVKFENNSWYFEQSRDGVSIIKLDCTTAEQAEAVRKIIVKKFWGKTIFPN